ncbi:MAG: inorganic phosphate transporter, partial [Promethearchaeota archaeon]
TVSPLVGANVLKFKVVLIIGGAATAIGLIFLSHGVGCVIGEELLRDGITYSVFMLLAVLMSTIIWLILGSLAGIPLSSTHSTIGSIFGVMLVYSFFNDAVNPFTCLNYDLLTIILLSWILSPIIGFVVSYLLFKIISKFYLSKLKGLNKIERTEKYFTWLLLIAIIIAELFVGGNDGANAVGLLYGVYGSGSITTVEYYILIIFCGLCLFLGLFTTGRFVIKNLASQMTDARPSEGFIIQSSTGLIIMFCTVVWFLPVSHSHVIVFCIIGLNVAKRKEIDYKAIGKMVFYWIVTFPIAAILASVIYIGFITLGYS